jgi:hypothetical protein
MNQSVSKTPKPVYYTERKRLAYQVLKGGIAKRSFRRGPKQALFLLSALPDDQLPTSREALSGVIEKYLMNPEQLRAMLADWEGHTYLLE